MDGSRSHEMIVKVTETQIFSASTLSNNPLYRPHLICSSPVPLLLLLLWLFAAPFPVRLPNHFSINESPWNKWPIVKGWVSDWRREVGDHKHYLVPSSSPWWSVRREASVFIYWHNIPKPFSLWNDWITYLAHILCGHSPLHHPSFHPSTSARLTCLPIFVTHCQPHRRQQQQKHQWNGSGPKLNNSQGCGSFDQPQRNLPRRRNQGSCFKKGFPLKNQLRMTHILRRRRRRRRALNHK